MVSDDSGILEKMLEGLTDEEKENFLNGKINKNLLFKFLNADEQDKVIDNTLHDRVFDFLSQGNLQSTYIEGHFKKTCPDSIPNDIDLKAKEELKRLQRLHHLLPRNATHISPSDSGSIQVSPIFLKLWMLPHLGKLADNKSDAISSAHSIKRMGRRSWLKNYAHYLGSEDVANEIYDNAARASAQTMILLSSYLDHITSPMHVLPSIDTAASAMELLCSSDSDAESELSNWKELFGSLDFCQCEHCSSVYGPAAYFVDLLHFLDTHGDVYDSQGNKTSTKVLDVLLEKRKDLGNIKLNCPNTETPLPYIDLVNEILESAVVKVPDFSYQTTRTPDELKVSPENIKIEAYNTLRDAVYPFDLPFDLWSVQADSYMEKIGIQRQEIMRNLQSEEEPTDVEIAAVHLGLTPVDLKIITGATVDDKSTYKFWGLKENNFDLLRNGNNLSLLLRQSGLSYEEFSRLLDARFINPKREIQTVFCEEADCSLDKAAVKTSSGLLPDDFFVRFLRFVRLNGRLNWKLGELDRALSVFSANAPDKLNDDIILKLSILKQLSTELSLKVDECLSWWSDKIDTTGDMENPSLYQRIFLDKAQNTETFRLNDQKNELEIAKTTGHKIKDHEAELLGPLKINTEDLRLLSVADKELNLSNLSMIYRNVSFSRALGLSIDEFLCLRNLFNLDPLDRNAPEKTIQFWQSLSKIHGSNLSIADLCYLIKGACPAGRSSAPSDDQIISALSSIREEIRKIQSKYIKQQGIEIGVILRHSATYLDEKELEGFKNIIEKGIDTYATYNNILKKISFLDINWSELEKKSLNEKCEYIYKILLDLDQENEKRKLITQKISEIFHLDLSISENLLQEIKNSEDIIELLSGDKEISRGKTPDLFFLYEWLNRAALIIKDFNLSYIDLIRQETFFLKDVPIKKLFHEPNANDFLDVMDWVEFRDSLPKDRLAKLYPAKKCESAEEFIEYLADLTGWNKEDLIYLSRDSAFNYTYPKDFQSLSKVLSLKRTFDLLKRIGINAQTLWSWRVHGIDQTSAEAMISTVKSKYTEDQWPELTKTLRNSLREQQRNALISYLLAHSEECLGRELKTRDELFEHLLIDVEMAPCMLTSRIKQAISTVQLFVQRCFMNLEPEVKFDEDAALQWAWMKSYRVWEADRKIFLYPENWIEPELRDDKTPLFQDMEMALAQGQMNNSLAETALRGYLNALKDISNLKIVGMYQERKLSDFQRIMEKTLTGHTGPIGSVAVTPDGRYAISGSFDKSLKIWDLQEGSCKTLTGHEGNIYSVAVTPDGRYAISGSEDKSLNVWDLQEGSCIKTLTGHTAPIVSVAVTPDGRYAISGSFDKSLKVWDLQIGGWIREHKHNDYVSSIAVTPDSRYAVSGSADNTLKVWDLQEGSCIKTLTGHTQGINSVAVTPDGRYAISGSYDKTLKVWDLQEGSCKTLTGHTLGIKSVAVTPDGRYAISGSEDRSLKVWDLQEGSCIKTLTGHTQSINSVAVTPDGRYAISGSYENSLKVWDLSLRVRDLAGDEGHKNPVYAIAVTPDGRNAISGSADNTLKVWDMQSGKLVRNLASNYHNHTEAIRAVAVTPDGRYAISGSNDKSLKVWDLQIGGWIRDLADHKDKVSSVAVTPDGCYAISGSDDKTLKVWDLQSGKWVRDLATQGHDHIDNVNAVAVTPDSRYAVSCSGSDEEGGILKVWDLHSGEWVRDLAGDNKHKRYVSGVAITPDGLHAISSSWDRTLKVWDLHSGEWVRDLATQDHDHTDDVRAVAVTPDGRYAISGSADNTLKVWDLKKQRDNWLGDLASHTSSVNAVAVSPDGRYAIWGSADCTLKIWGLKKVVIENTHAIARNSAKPNHYYHRTESGGSWTPWKRIDADISGDHVMPAFHNSRLYLFWPTFEENHYTVKASDPKNPDEIKKYYSIKLSFIECRDGQWSGQSQSTALIDDKDYTHFDVSLQKYSLNATIGLIDDKDYTHFDSDEDKHKFFFEIDQSFVDDLRILVFRKSDKISRLPKCFRFLDSINDFIVESCDTSGPVISGPKNSEILDLGFELRFKDQKTGTLSIDLLNQNEDLLKSTNSNSIILMPRQRYLERNIRDDGFSFFFLDGNQCSRRSFFVDKKSYRYEFQTYYHPYVSEMIKSLQAHGIDGLLDPREKWFDARDLRRQQIEKEFFENTYVPTENVLKPYPKEEIDFSYGGAYSNYNWELFFHTSFSIAKKLSQEQRFEEAQRWFHFIFNPTSVSNDPVPDRFWNVKPFYKIGIGNPLGVVMQKLSEYKGKPIPEELKQVIEDMRMQIEGWRQDPSNPHRIARLRISAYKKSVVMKYLDNLIAWGDYLFRQDTLESINEAIQLYVLAHQILGKRPESIPAQKSKHDMTFIEVREKLDEFSNFIANIENHVCLMGAGEAPLAVPDSEPLHLGPSLFFCIPKNDNLLSYWDTVEDRLYKIRHCMNIEGTERSLALFEPPIDPGQLVRAAAAGAVVGMMPVTPVALPRYRFPTMLRKAIEFCADVEGLGNAFLSALEKKDAEGLERLNSNQNSPDMHYIKEKQVEEAKEIISELNEGKAIIEQEIKKYEQTNPADVVGWIAKGMRSAGSVASFAKGVKEDYDDRNSGKDGEQEIFNRNRMGSKQISEANKINIDKGRDKAKASMALAQTCYTLESAFTSVPMIIIGGAGAGSSPVSLTVMGGNQVKGKGVAAARVFEMIAQILNLLADAADMVQEGLRQKAELEHKKKQAENEKGKIDKQINAAAIRLDIANKELENQKLQEKNAQEIAAYMRSKFTNLELYDWMVSQLSTLYFQYYNLAFDMAKQAEKAYQFELGLSNANFVQYGQWDSLKKGLLSGERLKLQLMRMEAAYLENNKREYEITKHISLAAANPAALIELITKGECEVELDEILFDLDYPGQYMRRIKAISLTIDGEIEPYSSVSCKLTMEKNTLRVKSSPSKPYARDTKNEDSRFLDDYACVQSIVTSSGKDDSGMFELDLKDERYLPFEGAGVISKWRIELPNHNPDFQVGSNVIEDVIFNIRYTAREGGNGLRDAARKMITDNKDKFMELLKTKGFRQILLVENVQASNPLNINPPKIAGINEFSVEQVDLFIIVTENTDLKARLGEHIVEFKETYGDLRHSHISDPGDLSNCKIEFTEEGFDPKKVKYMAIMLKYKVLD